MKNNTCDDYDAFTSNYSKETPTMDTLKQATFQALLDRVNTLRADVFTAREPGDDEMRRAQGLLSEVRDLIQEAITKLPVVGDRTTDGER